VAAITHTEIKKDNGKILNQKTVEHFRCECLGSLMGRIRMGSMDRRICGIEGFLESLYEIGCELMEDVKVQNATKT